MPALCNKTILLISPQSWGIMFLAKHHYAIGLAKKGNRVYFLNPPEESRSKQKKSIEIISSGIDNLWLVKHKLWFPYNIKFHAISFFHLLMRLHIKKLIRKIACPIDIIWSFDLGNIYPFHFFGERPYKIFHPVDEPLNKAAIDSAQGCNIIFSVTKEILEKYHNFTMPRYFVNHGVSEDFLLQVDINKSAGKPIHVGFSGNLLRKDIDRDILLRIIGENPDVVFEFFGSYSQAQSNIGGIQDSDVKNFVLSLKSYSNVKLHGAIAHQMLAIALHQMDAFIICYDIKKDQSGGTNYHKIMEYLSTGKVIISNNVTTYSEEPELIRMAKSRDKNNELPGLFKETMTELSFWNSYPLQQKRIKYASQNSYQKQIEKISEIIFQY